MKRVRLSIVTVAILLLAACTGRNNGLEAMLDTADFYAVKADTATRWQMMSTDGMVMLPERYVNAPSVALDGVFSAYSPTGISVYRLNDDNSVTTIADSIRYAGAMVNDRMPVCRRNSAISVIDRNGTTIFTLYQLGGNNYNACNAYYSCGLLNVRLADSNLWGAVDTEGNVVIEPEYDYLSVFNDDYALALRKEKLFIVSLDGEYTELEGDYEPVTSNFLYSHAIALRHPDGVRVIIDTDGDALELESTLVPLTLCKDGAVVMNHLGQLGMVDYDGDEIMPASERVLMPISGTDKMLVMADSTFSVVAGDGELLASFPAGTLKVEGLFGGKGFVATTSNAPRQYALYDKKVNPVAGVTLTAFDRHISLNDIILSDREADHKLFNTADPGDETPEWMEKDSEEPTD